MLRISNSARFAELLVYGLNQYSKKTLESITLSQSTERTETILKPFQELMNQLGDYETKNHFHGHMEVAYCIVCVNNQHIHGLIRKPFQKIERVRSIWQKLTEGYSHVTLRTLTQTTKQNPIQLNKMIDYFAQQSSHHDLPVEFYQSNNWGQLSNQEAMELSQTKFNDSGNAVKQQFEKKMKEAKKQGRKYDPAVMIDNRFYLWSELTEEQKQLFNNKK